MTCEHCGAPTRWVDGWKLDQCIESKMDFFVKIRELRAQVAALEVDAGRYRWLALQRVTPEHWGGRWSIVIEGPAPTARPCKDQFDAAIEAARKGEA